MNETHAELLARLESFNPDEPGVALSFTHRLARENGWRLAFANRVVTEYKRFAFLAMTAGHPVTPSDEVDQAWHLHLTYTNSYWKIFCGEVLGRPLHHNPTKGGAVEGDKFDDWYAKTLASYEHFFGHPPPADIWPEAATRFGDAPYFVRINTRRTWVWPRPRWFPILATGSTLGLVVLLTTGCVGAMAVLNIFDWRGPDFLMFYVLACVPAFLVAWMRRDKLALPDGNVTPDDLPRDPYVVAALTGGATALVNAGIASLCDRQLLVIGTKGTIQTVDRNASVENLHPFERGLYEDVTALGAADMKSIREKRGPAAKLIIEELKRRGLVVPAPQARKAMLQPLLLACVVPVLGVIKVAVGVTRGKPVGFLVMLCIISFVVALFMFLRRPHQSRLGKQAVQRLRAEHSKLKHAPSSANGASVAVPLAVALFGLGVLEGTALANLQKKLTPPSGTSGCGSSCGSGGGGGCGGGGCGGCGGD